MKAKAIFAVGTLSLAVLCLGYFQVNNVDSSVEAKETSESVDSTSSLTQDDVKNMMINSIDNFTSAKGEFTYYSIPAGFDCTVSYEVSNVEGDYASHIVTTNNTTGDIEENYFDGVNFTTIRHGEKNYESYVISAEVIDPGKELYSFDSRKTTNFDGEPVTFYRIDPTKMGMAGNSLFPQGFAFSYLEDNSLWSITGYEEYLGREVVVLEGYPGDYQAEKIQSESFKMWVDTETGALLKYESYNSEGEIMECLETSSIVFNDPAVNKLSYASEIPKGYTNISSDF